MSLILEALRKSEAERQIGRPPGLLSPAGVAEPERRWRLGMPIAVIAVLLVAAGAWWLGTRSAPNPATQVAASGGDTAPAGSAAAVPETNTTAPSPAAAPPASSAAGSSAGSGLPAQTRPPQVGGGANRNAPAATTSAPAPAAAAGSDTPKPAVPASPLPRDPASVPAAPTIPYARLDQMPAAERASLPSLKLTVHVYAEERDRRFAIIDGHRRADGDVIQDGLSVEEILPDGVLLKVGARTWMLPRP